MRPFSSDFVNPKWLETFLRKPDLIKEKRNLLDDEKAKSMYLYEFGHECEYFTIILDGKALVQVGKDGLEISAGLFSFYGVNALLDESDLTADDVLKNELIKKKYTPEFSLIVESYCVYLQIARKDWLDLVRKTHMERNYRTAGLPSNANFSTTASNYNFISIGNTANATAAATTNQIPINKSSATMSNNNNNNNNTNSNLNVNSSSPTHELYFSAAASPASPNSETVILMPTATTPTITTSTITSETGKETTNSNN